MVSEWINGSSISSGVPTGVCIRGLPKILRIARHNRGEGAKYTRSRRPVALVYSEALEGHGEALRREMAVKKLSRLQKEALISG